MTTYSLTHNQRVLLEMSGYTFSEAREGEMKLFEYFRDKDVTVYDGLKDTVYTAEEMRLSTNKQCICGAKVGEEHGPYCSAGHGIYRG